MKLLVLLPFILAMARTYPFSNQETAVSLNGEPVGLYGQTINGLGNIEEYAASLSGLPIGLYQKTEYLPPLLQQAPEICPQKLAEDLYPQFTDSKTAETPVEPPKPSSGIRPRSGSFAAASASADAANQKTSADAVSAQGLPSGLLGLLGGFTE